MNKNKKTNIASDSFFLFLGSSSESIVNLVVGMILVRHFVDKTVFATYSQSIFLAQTLVAFIPLGLHRAIIYFFPRVKSPKAFALHTIIMTSSLIGLCGSVIILLRGHVSIWLNNPELASLIPTIVIITWLLNFHSILLQVLLGTYRAKIAGLILLSYNFTYFLAIIFGTSLNYDVKHILLLIIFVQSIKALITLFFCFKLPGEKKQISNLNNIPAQLKYSIPLGLSSFTGMIGKTIDRFIVMSIFSPAVFAVYDRGAITIPFIEQIPYSISGVLQTHLTRLYKEGNFTEFLRLWHKSIIQTAKIMLPIMVFAWIIAERLIVFINTDAYIDSVVYFRIYLFLILFHLSVYPTILMTTGFTNKILQVSLIYLILNVSLSIILVKLFHLGPIGPAIATVIAELLRMVLFLKSISFSVKTNFKNVFPWSNIIKVIILSTIVGLLLYPVSLIDLNINMNLMIEFKYLLHISIQFILFFSIYLILGLLTKMISKEDLKIIKLKF